MATTKVTLTLDVELLKRVKLAAKGRRARSLSAFVNAVLHEQLEGDEWDRVLAEILAERGKPSKEDLAWSRRVLAR